MESVKFSESKVLNHFIAFATVMIWGTTFVSTKILLQSGLSASQIMIFRFLLSYLLMLPLARRFRSDSMRDEALLLLSGVLGGSLYFFTENLALEYTLVTNVSLILCTIPILTLILSRILLKGVRISLYAIIGSLVSLLGVSLVIFNGSYILKVSPIGDLLTFIAALSWSAYCLLIKQLQGRYSGTFITRKVFFYGVLTLMPITLWQGNYPSMELIMQPVVIGNLLFLSVLASLICFLVWTRQVRVLGASTALTYLYLQPVASLATSHYILGERITAVAILGGLFVLSGLIFVERGERLTAQIGRYIEQCRLKS